MEEIIGSIMVRNRPRSPHKAILVCALYLTAGFASAALAEDFGVKAVHILWAAQTPDRQEMKEVLARPSVMREAADTVWSQIRTSACDAIKQQLGGPGALPNGMSATNITCTMSARGTVQLEAGWQPVRFGYLTTGNSLSLMVSMFGVPTPIAVTYDLQLLYDVNVFANNIPLTVVSESASVKNVQGQGAAAILSTLVPILSTHLTDAWKSRTDLQSSFTAQLANLNQQLRPPTGYVPVGHWVNKLSGTVILAYAPQGWPGRLNVPSPPLNRDMDAAWLSLSSPAATPSQTPPNRQTRTSFLDKNGFVHACMTGNGQFRAVHPGTGCAQGEVRIQWRAMPDP